MSPRDHKPRLDGVQLTALFFETAFNGVFWVLFIQTLETLYFRSKQLHESFFKPMTLTALLLFCTITGHWFTSLLTAYKAFILPQNLQFCVAPGDLNPAEKVYLTLSDPKAVLGSAFYVTSTLIGDAFMVYRLYIVWGRNKFIAIPPTMLCIALAVTGSMVTYLFSKSQEPIFATAGSWITSCFVLTFLSNLYSTILIAFKIFLSNRSFGRAMNAGIGLSKLIEILVESAALYSACVITALITYVANSNVQFVMVAVTNPVIGIIFCLIVLRVHRASTSTHGSDSRGGVTGSSHALRPVAIKITTQSQLDTDSHYPKGSEYGTSFLQHGSTQSQLNRESV